MLEKHASKYILDNGLEKEASLSSLYWAARLGHWALPKLGKLGRFIAKKAPGTAAKFTTWAGKPAVKGEASTGLYKRLQDFKQWFSGTSFGKGYNYAAAQRDAQTFARKRQAFANIDINTYLDKMVAKAKARGLKPGTEAYNKFTDNKMMNLEKLLEKARTQGKAFTGKWKGPVDPATGTQKSRTANFLLDPNATGMQKFMYGAGKWINPNHYTKEGRVAMDGLVGGLEGVAIGRALGREENNRGDLYYGQFSQYPELRGLEDIDPRVLDFMARYEKYGY